VRYADCVVLKDANGSIWHFPSFRKAVWTIHTCYRLHYILISKCWHDTL